jgi:hypothetical protein
MAWLAGRLAEKLVGWLAIRLLWLMTEDRKSRSRRMTDFSASHAKIFSALSQNMTSVKHFLNTIFVWSKLFSTDFHTKLSKYWMSRLAKPPLKLLSLLRFWRQNIGKDFSATHAKILPCHEKTWPLLFKWEKKSNHYFNSIWLKKYKANLFYKVRVLLFYSFKCAYIILVKSISNLGGVL